MSGPSCPLSHPWKCGGVTNRSTTNVWCNFCNYETFLRYYNEFHAKQLPELISVFLRCVGEEGYSQGRFSTTKKSSADAFGLPMWVTLFVVTLWRNVSLEWGHWNSVETAWLALWRATCVLFPLGCCSILLRIGRKPQATICLFLSEQSATHNARKSGLRSQNFSSKF